MNLILPAKTTKYLLKGLFCLLFLGGYQVFGQKLNQTAPRQRVNLDKNWKFHLGNSADPAQDFNYGIANLFAKTKKTSQTPIDESFNDNGWKTVQLPHDWAVHLPITFSQNEDQLSHGYRPVGGLYPQNSIGWYRKKFLVPAKDSGQQFSLTFDGIYRDSKVWINGIYLGSNFSGYLGQSYDITDFLYFNKANTITVRVDATQFEGWFYEGAGINRHVWLNKTQNIHVDPQNYYAHAKVEKTSSLISLEVPVLNGGNKVQTGICIISELRTRDGKVVARSHPAEIDTLPAKTVHLVKQQLEISHPKLWDLDHPYLYRIVTRVMVNGKLVDQYFIRFGVRDIQITADRGVLLNDKPVKIKGTNIHQDHAGVGTALPDALQYYRIQLLKAVGSNAIRTSHGAPAPEFLDACDSLGMLVVDEQRLLNSGLEYKSQFERLIKRDRNHPSIFLWSIGNEEGEIQKSSIGKRVAQDLLAVQNKLDPYRIATYAADLGNVYHGVNEVMAVRGFNYRVDYVHAYHKAHPEQAILGTEMGSTVMTRGIYNTDSVRGYVIDQDSVYPWWAGTAEHWWQLCADEPWMMGGFVWTGFDYRGEPTPFKWPNVNSHFGMMDLCGFPKNVYYYYKSVWSDAPVLHIGQQWNRKGQEGKLVNVWVYGNAPEVELFLNGKSLGRKLMPKYGHLEWNVPYAAGILKAVGYLGQQKITDSIVTTGPATKIGIQSNVDHLNANGKDIAVINLTALDISGRAVPDANDRLLFSLAGDGRILGFGNGDPSDHDPETSVNNKGSRRLFNGHAQIILQAGNSASSLELKITLNGHTQLYRIPQID
jgi:beta-galactosidase